MENLIKTYDVVIATPGSRMESEYVRSLIKTTKYLSNKKITWKYVNGRSSMVAAARERCLFEEPFNRGINQELFDGEFDYKKIFWIDSDMSWEIDEFIILLEEDKDMISAACMMGDNHQVAAYGKIGSTPLTRGAIISLPQRPQKIEACGMAFLVMKKGVLENTERPWFGDIQIPLIGPDGNEINWTCGSEDIAFCERARRAGFEIWLDPTVRVGHVKQQMLKV